MTKKSKSSKLKDHTIKLTISLDEDGQNANVKTTNSKKVGNQRKSLFVDEANLLKLANLSKKPGERNTEHGKTLVQIIDFRDSSQRRKIIRMLVDHYSEILWKMLPYLRNLGGHRRAEIRKRVSESVGELMCEDFIRVKDEVLVHWAMHGSAIVNANVGLALAIVAQDERYAENVKSLLNHWVTIPNPDLNWTALASCVSLCSIWPEEILDFVEKSINRTRVELLALSIFVIRELCDTGNADKVLPRLANWIRSDKDRQTLREGSALIFLEAIDLNDITSGGQIDRAVEIYRVGLEDRSLDNMGVVRAAMLEKLKDWMESGSEKKSLKDRAEKLITRLYLRSDERGKERLIFNLERWSHAKNGQGKEFMSLLDSLSRKDR